MSVKAATGSAPKALSRLSRSSRFRVHAGRSTVVQKRNPGDLSGIGPSPWPDLPIEDIYGKSKALRLRQHVNPLRIEHQTPCEPPDWQTVFEDARLPLVLDIGCAGGRFVLALAHKWRSHNFLGLDIRTPLLERANEWAGELGIGRRALFVQANATVSLESMLRSYPGPVELAAVQFPDPHFKKRHKKRRIVQPQLITALADLMPSEGRVFLQSDIEDVTAEMRDEFEEYGSEHFRLAPEHGALSEPGDRSCDEAQRSFSEPGTRKGPEDPNEGSQHVEKTSNLKWHAGGYLAENPLGVPTEREVQTLKQDDPVFRVLLVRR